jgi:hypothetical protein
MFLLVMLLVFVSVLKVKVHTSTQLSVIIAPSLSYRCSLTVPFDERKLNFLFRGTMVSDPLRDLITALTIEAPSALSAKAVSTSVFV